MRVFICLIAYFLVFAQSSTSKLFKKLEDKIEKDFEEGPYFQGDIVLTQDQAAAFFNGSYNAKDIFTGILGKKYRWPKNLAGKVVVPYKISKSYSKLKCF